VSEEQGHLDIDQIELLIGAPRVDARRAAEAGALDRARRHVNRCAECQRLLSHHQEAARILNSFADFGPKETSNDCPPVARLYEMAAGIVSPEESESLLNHITRCDHCGPLLRQAAIDMGDDVEPSEVELLASLKSGDGKRQNELAGRLSAIRELDKPSLRARSWWRVTPVWVTATAAVLMVSWFGVQQWMRPSPEQLLAQAFAERRTVEMRMVGAGYAPLRQDRKDDLGGDRMNRPALLKAESETSRALQTSGEDPLWVQARGRASLLEGDSEGAVAALEKAAELKPTNTSIKIDLASAYFDRGNRLSRSQDFGKAVDILGSVLATEPNNEVAMFNSSIALESCLLYEQARTAWIAFLREFPKSLWAPEARDRVNKLDEKIREQKQKVGAVLKPPEEFALAAEQRQEILSLDGRIEQYLEIAIREWLPAAYATNGGSDRQREGVSRGLKDLAEILRSRHDDRWLTDLMSAGPALKETGQAIGLIAEAKRRIDRSDENRALHAARKAAVIFGASNNSAGELYAQFLIVYSEQLSHMNERCAKAAKRLASRPELNKFAWLQVQLDLESAICASTSDERAEQLARRAEKRASQHTYPVLRSRAIKTLSGIEWASGDSDGSWNVAFEGLREYWHSELPPLRGYNLLTDLDVLAEDEQETFLQAAVLREAVPMIDSDPDMLMRGFEIGRLGRALLKTGDLNGADRAFEDMRRLFEATPKGDRARNLGAEAELGLALVDIDRKTPDLAVRRLDEVRSSIEDAGDEDLALEFFKTYGIAQMQAGDKNSAQSALTTALDYAEAGLRLVRDEQGRLRWSRRNELLYRAIVLLKLEAKPAEALAFWELYKGSSVRVGESSTDDQGFLRINAARNISEMIGGDAVFVSYFFSPRGLVIWVADHKGVMTRETSTKSEDIQILSRHFSEHCADPSSKLKSIRDEANQLYRKIFLPIEDLIRDRRLLMVEPDGDLKRIPFGILVDDSGHYLMDRFAVTVSPGLEYEAYSRRWHGISERSRVLVVGNPSVRHGAALPDSEREARYVSTLFRNSQLLIREQATFKNLAKELSEAEVLHFSGHAIRNPNSAGILLAETEVFDAMTLRRVPSRRSQLVVLSACSTADGRTGAFDDEDSLVREFIRFGTPEVVASRWPVDSTSTSELMREMYRNLLEGNGVADSLQKAMIAVRARKEYSHPFYWAGFSVFGRG
jgi:CHAT domain-containing protein/tetratricopeptide (TPR) repeat protein